MDLHHLHDWLGQLLLVFVAACNAEVFSLSLFLLLQLRWILERRHFVPYLHLELLELRGAWHISLLRAAEVVHVEVGTVQECVRMRAGCLLVAEILELRREALSSLQLLLEHRGLVWVRSAHPRELAVGMDHRRGSKVTAVLVLQPQDLRCQQLLTLQEGLLFDLQLLLGSLELLLRVFEMVGCHDKVLEVG